jgi:DNA-binding Xre family transcriptional regulator
MVIRLRVKEVAASMGIGQSKLARMADMDLKTVRRIYKDPYAEISTVTLARLAQALNVDARELIEWVDTPHEHERE